MYYTSYSSQLHMYWTPHPYKNPSGATMFHLLYIVCEKIHHCLSLCLTFLCVTLIPL